MQSKNNNKKNPFSNLMQKEFKIVERAKVWFIIPIVVILIGALIFGLMGFNLGIDFTGGTVVEISVGSVFEADNASKLRNQYKSDIKSVLNNNGLELSYYQISGTGEETDIIIRYQDKKGLDESEMEILSAEVVSQLQTKLALSAEDISQSQRIAPTASSELIINCLLAILISVILILIYIAFRFELSFGLSAIVALLHDVLIMLALMAIFQIQMNSAFVAALITIIGYSINNTIVIFDRIRENKKKESLQSVTNATIANLSIKESLTRTMYTTFTTLLAIVMLAVLGVSSIREFAIPIIFGILAGTYSSILVAGPLWAIINDNTVRRNSKVAKTIQK